MSKTVSFGMFWQEYGHCTVILPDEIDESDGKAVLDFIKNNWDDFPLPQGEYVMGSDELDEGADITVCLDNGDVIDLGSPDEIEEGDDEADEEDEEEEDE